MEDEWFLPEDSYDSLVASAGTIVKDWNIGDWQGDYVYLLKNGNKFGFTVVGYGSCSYCDALQSCDNQEEVDILKESIVKDIFWGTAEEVEAYAIKEDANRWYHHDHEWKTIKRELKAELRKG
jgi:glycosyltransferase involved in cell wall biosynthesis